MKTTLKFCAAILLAMAVHAIASAKSVDGERIHVNADSKAKYVVVGELETNAKGNVVIVTKRTSSWGDSYSKREVNCANMTFRYLGDGDTLTEMEGSKPSPDMTSLIRGSSSDVISRFACANK